MNLRLIYCAIILLVLLFVGSAMGVGDEPYRFFSTDTGICLSLKNRKNLTACCNKNDRMQMIRVTKLGASEGIYHTVKGDRILCYDSTRGRFKSKRRSFFKELEQCRHLRSRHDRRHRHSGNSNSIKRSMECPFSAKDKSFFKHSQGKLQCVFHETLASGYTYISVDKDAKYLAIRKGRVQKIMKNGVIKEPKDRFRGFLSISEKDSSRISSADRICAR